jgi:hypothetical protein
VSVRLHQYTNSLTDGFFRLFIHSAASAYRHDDHTVLRPGKTVSSANGTLVRNTTKIAIILHAS